MKKGTLITAIGTVAITMGIKAYKKRRDRKLILEAEAEALRVKKLREEEARKEAIRAEAERIRKENVAKAELNQNEIAKAISAYSPQQLATTLNETIRYYEKHGFYLSRKKEYSKQHRDELGRVHIWYASLTFKKKR